MRLIKKTNLKVETRTRESKLMLAPVDSHFLSAPLP